MVVAQEQALRLGHDHVGTEHILLGLLEESEGAAAKVLDLNGVGFESVLQKVEENTGSCGSSSTVSPPFTPRAKKVLELAMREAIGFGNDQVGTEHILAGLLREGHGVGARALVSLGVDLKGLRAQVTELLSGARATGLAEVSAGNAGRDRAIPGGRAVLDQFGCNLTQLAREHKLDPVIGRDGEIERVMQVLSRRTKSNPVLIGEPGGQEPL
jgi:ATP-dependent Clp protease ATP-binding subunit ClpC